MIGRVAGKLRWLRDRALIRRAFRPRRTRAIVRLGSAYGGWQVPADAAARGGVCYSAGVGADISFDAELVSQFPYEVHAFDPTPTAARHLDSLAALPERFSFHPVGLWNEDTMLELFLPRDPVTGSWSVGDMQHSGESTAFPVRRLSTIARELGHERIDLLKLDIEGAEYAVLEDMLASAVDVDVLLVEFHVTSARRLSSMARTLRSAGYRALAQEGLNVTLVHER